MPWTTFLSATKLLQPTHSKLPLQSCSSRRCSMSRPRAKVRRRQGCHRAQVLARRQNHSPAGQPGQTRDCAIAASAFFMHRRAGPHGWPEGGRDRQPAGHSRGRCRRPAGGCWSGGGQHEGGWAGETCLGEEGRDVGAYDASCTGSAHPDNCHHLPLALPPSHPSRCPGNPAESRSHGQAAHLLSCIGAAAPRSCYGEEVLRSAAAIVRRSQTCCSASLG
jgi:hypothetical protein